ncbi:MAG: ABC transporter ATP-binding protein [Deltaproteobacteria bacterium]|nr:ABC transporter ATP-binding protein [Deltaproteobacteria bacterium]
MIEAIDLAKKYGDLVALKGINFKISAGKVVGLLGPNGAGKTSTMRILTTFLPPTSGTARIAGYDICQEADAVRRCIGYLPETPPLYAEMRVGQYLKFVAKIKGVPAANISSYVDEAIERSAIQSVRERLCGNLSKGFRQRVGLAQALVHKPRVVILDEPTSGLDPAQIIEIRRLISGLCEDHTVILSTHILAEVAQVCTDVIIIANGSIVADGSIEELTREKSLEERFMEAIAGERLGEKVFPDNRLAYSGEQAA